MRISRKQMREMVCDTIRHLQQLLATLSELHEDTIYQRQVDSQQNKLDRIKRELESEKEDMKRLRQRQQHRRQVERSRKERERHRQQRAKGVPTTAAANSQTANKRV